MIKTFTKSVFIRNIYKKAVLILLLFCVFSFGQVVMAAIVNTEKIEKAGSDGDADKLDKYKEKVEKKLKSTTQKKDILTNQVKLYNLKVSKAVRNLGKVEKKLERNELELESLKKEVDKKNQDVLEFKESLRRNIILYRRNQESFKLKVLSSNSSLVSLMNKSNYLNKLSEQINSRLQDVKKEKEDVVKKQNEAEEAKKEIKKNEAELAEEKVKLESQRRIKNDFLNQTKGDESKYKVLLARIDEQKQKLINLSLLSISTKQSIGTIKKNAKKPKSGLAKTSWYYAQDDSDWGNKTIGFSKTLMRNYGCAVTALSMVFTKEDKKINPGKLAKKPLFYRDLIVWPNKWGKLKLTSGRSHRNINWGTVDKKIKKGIPVIVFIRSKSGAGHYVVVHHKDKKGKYVVHDPLFGANLYLETSKKLVSAIYKSGVVVDQMLIYE